MKKLTHIAAPVALTALLSACAGPVTLENLGPGELAAVQQSVVDTLVNKGPDGGLSPVQQAAQDALTKPGDNNTPSMLQQAVQNAVNEALGEGTVPLFRSVDFKFHLQGADDRARREIIVRLKEIFRTVDSMDDSDEVEPVGDFPEALTYRVNPDYSYPTRSPGA